jgi:hypothetical protein
MNSNRFWVEVEVTTKITEKTQPVSVLVKVLPGETPEEAIERTIRNEKINLLAHKPITYLESIEIPKCRILKIYEDQGDMPDFTSEIPMEIEIDETL